MSPFLLPYSRQPLDDLRHPSEDFVQFVQAVAQRPDSTFVPRETLGRSGALLPLAALEQACLQETLDDKAAQIDCAVGPGVLPGLPQRIGVVKATIRNRPQLSGPQPLLLKDLHGDGT